MLPIAHAGHFVWVLYAVPVIVVGVSIVLSIRRERRDAREGGGEAEPAEPESPSS